MTNMKFHKTKQQHNDHKISRQQKDHQPNQQQKDHQPNQQHKNHQTNEQHRMTPVPSAKDCTTVGEPNRTEISNERKGPVVPKNVKTLFTRGHNSADRLEFDHANSAECNATFNI